jgi:hypothetical protein
MGPSAGPLDRYLVQRLPEPEPAIAEEPRTHDTHGTDAIESDDAPSSHEQSRWEQWLLPPKHAPLRDASSTWPLVMGDRELYGRLPRDVRGPSPLRRTVVPVVQRRVHHGLQRRRRTPLLAGRPRALPPPSTRRICTCDAALSHPHTHLAAGSGSGTLGLI